MSFLLSMTSARVSVALRGLALAALLAGCGEPKRIQGQVAVVGLAPDWQGYEARLLDANDHELQRIPVSADGQFRFSYGSAQAQQVEVLAGPVRLRAALTADSGSEPLRVSADTTAALALATVAGDLANAEWLDQIGNAVHAVVVQQGSARDDEAPALRDYADSWAMARMLAASEKHRIGYQLAHQAVLMRSQALRNSAFAATDPEMALAELSGMIRLHPDGRPLRWQHRSPEQEAWACTDYVDRPVQQRWPRGQRIWARLAADAAAVSAQAAVAQAASLNNSALCGHNDWRLPMLYELQSLAEQGQWRYPASLPLADGDYWALASTNSDQQEQLVVVRMPAAELVTADRARLLPLAFSADAPAPTKARHTTAFDLTALRAQYTQPSGQWPAPTVDEGIPWQELGNLPAVEFPLDNPYSEAKVALGQRLFFDTNLSAGRDVACASCHVPQQMWSDQRRVSEGTAGQKGRRQAMPVTNTAYFPAFFWDGRVTTLEQQSTHPVRDPLEMALTLEQLLQRLQEDEGYRPLFAAAFGDEQPTLDGFAKALATFQRTLISRPSAFDRFVQGDSSALDDQQLHGLHLYRTKARCMNCHSGPLLSDHTFRNTGLTYYGRTLQDRGRFEQSHSHQQLGAFRVPPLRDIAYSAPYMHNGVFPILARETKSGGVVGVIPMYNAGMTLGRNGNYPQYESRYDPFFPVIDAAIQPLGLSNEEMLALNAFLQAVSAEPTSEPAALSVLQNPAGQ